MRNVLLLFCMLLSSMMMQAQSNGNRLSVGVGTLYEKGFDATLAVEHEIQNHNAWEYFANGYVKYSKDKRVGQGFFLEELSDVGIWGSLQALCI